MMMTSEDRTEMVQKFLPLYETAKAVSELKRLEKLFSETGPVYIMEVRNKFNLTQRSLASRLGVSSCHLSRVENGHEPCSVNMMTNLWSVVIAEKVKDREAKQRSLDGILVAKPRGRVEVGVEGGRVGQD